MGDTSDKLEAWAGLPLIGHAAQDAFVEATGGPAELQIATRLQPSRAGMRGSSSWDLIVRRMSRAAGTRNRQHRPPLSAVPKLVWSPFIARHPAAHWVAGVRREGEPVKADARLQLGLMAKLIAGLAPKGSYA